MNLPATVEITRVNGDTVTLSELSLIFHDYNDRRIVVAILRPHFRSVVLWEGDEYDAVGDWTQAQAESRIIDILGPDIEASLQSLVCS